VRGVLLQAEAGEVRRMLEEASAQVAQQAAALSSMGEESDAKAAELRMAQVRCQHQLSHSSQHLVNPVAACQHALRCAPISLPLRSCAGGHSSDANTTLLCRACC
jgi:hypothetical protein